MEESVKFKVPKSQKLWLTQYDGRDNPIWIITSDAGRMRYYLYKVDGSRLEKVKTAETPADFFEEMG